MKTVHVHLGAKNFACTNDDGSHRWIIDEPLHKGGEDTGPDPYAALLGSLGSCTAITIKMYAERKGWAVQYIDVNVEMFSKPTADEKNTVFTRTITVMGNIDEAQLQRLRQIAKACPVSKILEGAITIETHIKKAEDVDTTTG